ncbi:MAG: 2-C-methyl-D-erythritol 4-phosphate cytidylyltransferase [Planctomycetes bacterium]|nr:2-C-methyl-D-erythritol 4-phosphate cytidylyltransferase [Planctomycetota bacterium]
MAGAPGHFRAARRAPPRIGCGGVKLAILVLAAGQGSRFGGEVPKAYVPCAGAPIVVHCVRRLAALWPERTLVLAADPAHGPHLDPILPALHAAGLDRVVAGGATRQESMRNAFAAAPEDHEVVLVHDAARPLFPRAAALLAIERAAAVGGALLAIPVTDTLKRADERRQVLGTVDRRGIWAAQTPQVLRRDLLVRALAAAQRDGFQATDDAALLEHAGLPVEVVPGSPHNLKITTREDLILAEILLRGEHLP